MKLPKIVAGLSILIVGLLVALLVSSLKDHPFGTDDLLRIDREIYRVEDVRGDWLLVQRVVHRHVVHDGTWKSADSEPRWITVDLLKVGDVRVVDPG